MAPIAPASIVFCYMSIVEDSYGVGQAAWYCFVANEKKQTVHLVISEFASVHDVSGVDVVIVDKDYKEIAAIQKIVPHARFNCVSFMSYKHFKE